MFGENSTGHPSIVGAFGFEKLMRFVKRVDNSGRSIQRMSRLLPLIALGCDATAEA
jgi:hypothetical protein